MEEKVIARIRKSLDKDRNALVKMEPLEESVWEGAVCLPAPTPLKANFKQIYRMLDGPLTDMELNRYSLTDLEDMLLRFENKKVIVLNHVEDLSPKPASFYYRLFKGGFSFVGFQQKRYYKHYTEPDVRRFLNTFDLANPEYRKEMRVECDLTPAVILVVSVVFVGYFYRAFVMSENSPNSFYTGILWILWVILLVVRTIVYMSYARRKKGGGVRY